MRQDSLRLQEFLVLEKQYGWPKRSQVGLKGVSHAYLLVQHAPNALQVSYLPKIKGSYKRGELSPPDYATYLDRVRIHQNKPQLYGTQYARRVLTDGREEDYLLPVENLAQLDTRRKKMQLELLSPRLKPGTLILIPETD